MFIFIILLTTIILVLAFLMAGLKRLSEENEVLARQIQRHCVILDGILTYLENERQKKTFKKRVR